MGHAVQNQGAEGSPFEVRTCEILCPLHDRRLEMRLPLQRDCGLTVIAELQLCDALSTRSLDLQEHDPHKAPGRAGHTASQMEFNSSETREDPPVRGALPSFALVSPFSAPPV